MRENAVKRTDNMGRVLIMSDIHGNLSALNAVLAAEPVEGVEGIILLGDNINYGPRSNEVIRALDNISMEKILINLWGNHEAAIYTGDDRRFSSERGKKAAEITRAGLTFETWKYLEKMHQAAKQEMYINRYRCLAVHGSLKDCLWGSIGHGESGEEYSEYDIVFSGHSHIPHFFSNFYTCDCPQYRNKKRTVFINPGSVGQPRDCNPNAHYAIIDTDRMTVQLNTVSYDIEYEMSLFSDDIDSFYKERLRKGI